MLRRDGRHGHRGDAAGELELAGDLELVRVPELDAVVGAARHEEAGVVREPLHGAHGQPVRTLVLLGDDGEWLAGLRRRRRARPVLHVVQRNRRIARGREQILAIRRVETER